MKQTKLGRSFYAIGGNENDAISAGINVKRNKMLAYIINGVLVGIAGMNATNLRIRTLVIGI